MPYSRPKTLPARRLPRLLIALSVSFCVSFSPFSHADGLTDIQNLVKAGQFPQALEKTDAYLSSKPKDAQGRFMKGLILAEMNRPLDAISVFTKLTEDYPELPEPYNNLAVLYAQQKQYEKARTALEMAIRTHPAYAVAYENLGDVYAKLASQAYDKALQLDSSNAAAQGKLSLIRELISTGTTPARAGAKPIASASGKQTSPASTANTEQRPAASTTSTANTNTAKPADKSAATPATMPPAEPAKPVAAAEKAPAEPVTKSAPDNSAVEASITTAVQNWASAWSRKDVKAYLAHYASGFQTPNGMSRKAWETERQQRIDKPGKISVTVSDIRISLNGDKATVKFRQDYKSASLNSSSGKTLVMVRNGGKWQILQERVG